MPDGVNFRVFREPVTEVSEAIVTFLKTNPQKERLFGEVLAVLCESAFYTYKAITRLLDKESKNKYVLQAFVLVRFIIDTFYSVVFLVDNPSENTKRYNYVTIREMDDDYKKFSSLHQQDPKKHKNPEDFKVMMRSNGKYFGLAQEEIEQIDKWEPVKKKWAIPSQVISGLRSEETKTYLKKNCQNHYLWCSDIAHCTGRAIGLHIYSRTDDSMKAQPGRFESDAVVMAIEYLVLIYSEIQSVIDCGIKQELKDLWNLLLEHNMEYAASLYERHKPYFEKN